MSITVPEQQALKSFKASLSPSCPAGRAGTPFPHGATGEAGTAGASPAPRSQSPEASPGPAGGKGPESPAGGGRAGRRAGLGLGLPPASGSRLPPAPGLLT